MSHKPYNADAPLSCDVLKYMSSIDFLLRETLDTERRTGQSDYLFLNEWWYNYYEQFMQE